MNFFASLFKKKQKTEPPPMPAWNAIVDMLYDQQLDTFADEVIDVIYSRDRSMRYIVLKENAGLLTYQLEAIYQFDEDEWGYICACDNALPAMWEPFRGVVGKSFFNNPEELLRSMESEPEYKQYF